MFLAEFKVSTRPACLTAVTRVDSTGLAEAAVATGAEDMPVKLPAPDLGTDAQPEPKSVVVAAPEPDGMDEALADDPDDADVLFVPLLQAAAPRARPAVTAETATRRLFTITPLHLNVR